MVRLFKWFEVEPNKHELKEVTFDVVSKDDNKIVIQIHTEANKPKWSGILVLRSVFEKRGN